MFGEEFSLVMICIIVFLNITNDRIVIVSNNQNLKHFISIKQY